MPIGIELVDGVDFSTEASRILKEAWSIPGISYTPEYVRWQHAFPAPRRLPSVAAFDGGDPVGFAGVAPRRFRRGAHRWDSGIVSFVAVLPEWRKRGIASGLYRKLLGALQRLGISVLTYGIPGSQGDRTLLKSYSEAGYTTYSLGVYRNYGFLDRGLATETAWEAEAARDFSALAGIIENCSDNRDFIWSDPDEDQLDHYGNDPRPRKLVLLQQRETGARGAAWIVRGEYQGSAGRAAIATVDNIWLPTLDATALPVLLRCAAALWPEPYGKPTIVSAPNLAGFDSRALRTAGIRETGGRFLGYFCSPEADDALSGCALTNSEIV